MSSAPVVAVVGSINTDLVVYARHLPRPGQTAMGGDLHRGGGGKGANQAVAAARLGARAHLVGRVGDDDFGATCLANLARLGVDTTYVTTLPGIPSGVALIVVDDSGENLIALAPGANSRLSPTDVELAGAAIASAKVLLLQLEVPVDASIRAAEIAREGGARIVLNPAPAPNWPLPAELLRLIDVIVPNESEAAALTGTSSVTEAARRLLAAGVSAAIVTLGAEGARMRTAATSRTIPAVPVEAVDTTGAGDAFCGGLGYALATGQTLDDAAQFATRVAALAVTRRGAQDAMPTLAEVEALVTAQVPA